MSPFYPVKAKERGVSVVNIGFVIGTMAVCQIIGSFFVGLFLKALGGRNCIIITATLLIISQSALLGYLEYVEDDQMFLYLSLLAQILGGIGAGANATSSMAILSSFDKNERE